MIGYDKNKLLQRLALGVVTALGVFQDNVPGSWRQIAHVCRDLPELTVKKVKKNHCNNTVMTEDAPVIYNKEKVVLPYS